jgi:hypothetical protein
MGVYSKHLYPLHIHSLALFTSLTDIWHQNERNSSVPSFQMSQWQPTLEIGVSVVQQVRRHPLIEMSINAPDSHGHTSFCIDSDSVAPTFAGRNASKLTVSLHFYLLPMRTHYESCKLTTTWVSSHRSCLFQGFVSNHNHAGNHTAFMNVTMSLHTEIT